MARDLLSAEQLKDLAKEFVEYGERIANIAGMIEKTEGLPGIPLHFLTLKNKHMLYVEDWIDDAERDANTVIRAFKKGVRSRIEISQSQAQRRKEKAEKPEKKRGK